MRLVGDILHNLKDTASVYHPDLILPTASQLDLPAAPQSDLKRSKGDSCSTEEIMATQVVVSNVHDTPKLTSSDPNDIRSFVEKVKSLHASEMTCRVDHWIVNSREKYSIASNLTGYRIIENRDDFETVMLNTALFITKMEQYLVARGNTEGAHTLDDKVRKSLKFNIHDVLDTRAVELMVDKWSQFIDDNINSYL